MNKALFIFLCLFSPSLIWAAKPNIVIIYADDMGYGDMSCQNPEAKLTTPNLDQLASEGMRFTDGHSSSGICTPSRYALLTGNYHWRRMHGIANAFGSSVFKDNELTLARMLKAQGYRTACIGKWHLGWDWDAIKKPGSKGYQASDFDWSKAVPDGPVDQGFDYYFGDGTINFPPYAFFENDRVTEAPTEMLDLGDMKTGEGNWEFRQGPMVKGWNPYNVLPTLSKKSVAFINKQKADQPFFLYFALPSPHAPIIPNKEFQGKTQAGAYGDFIFQSDWIAGQILQALKAKGLDKNTLVIFTADNGPEHYAYDRVSATNHKSTGPLRGLKRDIFEGGHRVPFIIKWPGIVEAGSVSNETVSQVDIMATLASITKFQLPNEASVDSYNLLNVLKGQQKTPLRVATVQNTFKDKYAIRQGKWVYMNTKKGAKKEPKDLKEYASIKTNTPGLLYDLSNDLGQKNNLHDKYPEVVSRMKKLLDKYRNEGRSVPQRN
ncbi:MAG: sulfatase-like hydrolase/transferase [Lentisphaeraceae bacterium]|nr:sulfatase-like hydrolase/transferase [Lentisphaeraceae bacterium]